MTDKEKAVVMAYTGVAMLTGDKFEIFYKYVEKIMGRPVFTHEFATCAEEIKEKAKFDFLALCVEEENGAEIEDASCENCEHAYRGADPLKIIQDSEYLFHCAAGHAYGGAETVCTDWKRKEGETE